MCLILFAYKSHPDYRLILLANRDEFFRRPSLPLNYWPDTPDILAGRDLIGRGTWLGVSRKGRLAAITNHRDPTGILPNAPSRGLLTKNYLCGTHSPQTYLENLLKSCSKYNGFNLIVGDRNRLFYLSNYQKKIEALPAGIHGLSNHLLNTPWPKVTYGKKQLERLVAQSSQMIFENLFTLLSDRSIPEDSQLPDTGVGLEWERFLSPVFILGPDYGTRCSSIILIENSGRIHFLERTFVSGSPSQEKPVTRSFTIEASAKD